MPEVVLDTAPESSRTLETCVYPVAEVDGARQVLLALARAGHNAGKWVPVGSLIGPSDSPREVALADLERVGIQHESLSLRGIVTEVGEAGWQTYLFLYIADALSPGVPAADDFSDEYRWFDVSEVPNLVKPQADSHFDPRILGREPFLFESRMMFDANERLVSVVNL